MFYVHPVFKLFVGVSKRRKERRWRPFTGVVFCPMVSSALSHRAAGSGMLCRKAACGDWIQCGWRHLFLEQHLPPTRWQTRFNSPTLGAPATFRSHIPATNPRPPPATISSPRTHRGHLSVLRKTSGIS